MRRKLVVYVPLIVLLILLIGHSNIYYSLPTPSHTENDPVVSVRHVNVTQGLIRRVVWSNNETIGIGAREAHKIILINPNTLSTIWKSEDLGSTIYGIGFSPNNKYIAGISFETGILKVYTCSGKIIYQETYSMYGTSVSWSPNGEYLVVALQEGYSGIGEVLIYSVDNWTVVRKIKLNNGVFDIVWLSDNIIVVTLGEIGIDRSYAAGISAIDVMSGEILWNIKFNNKYDAYTVDYSPNTRLLAVGVDKTIILYHVDTGLGLEKLWSMDLPGDVTGLSWSSNGTRLVAVGGKILILDTNASIVMDLTDYIPGRAIDAEWSPTSNKIVIGDDNGGITVFSFLEDREPRIIKIRELYLRNPIWDVDWNPRNDLLAVGLRNGTILVLDLQFNLIKRIDSDSAVAQLKLTDVEWNPDGYLLAVGYENDIYTSGALGVYSYSNKSLLWAWHCDGSVNRISWNRNGSYVASTCSREHRIYVFTKYGEMLWRSRDLGGWTDAVRWSPVEDLFVAGVSGEDSKIVLFNISGDIVKLYHGGTSQIFGLSWSPDGERVCASFVKYHKLYIFNRELELLSTSVDLGSIVIRNRWGPSNLIAVGTRDGHIFVVDETGRIVADAKASNYEVLSVEWKLHNGSVYLAASTKNGYLLLYEVISTPSLGCLAIYSNIVVNLIIDGASLGAINAHTWYNITLPTGSHNITLVNEEYGAFSIKHYFDPNKCFILIDPIKTTPLLNGTIRINSSTITIYVYLNGEYVGLVSSDNPLIFSLKPGTYELTFKSDNGITSSRSVVLDPGETIDIVDPIKLSLTTTSTTNKATTTTESPSSTSTSTPTGYKLNDTELILIAVITITLGWIAALIYIFKNY